MAKKVCCNSVDPSAGVLVVIVLIWLGVFQLASEDYRICGIAHLITAIILTLCFCAKETYASRCFALCIFTVFAGFSQLFSMYLLFVEFRKIKGPPIIGFSRFFGTFIVCAIFHSCIQTWAKEKKEESSDEEENLDEESELEQRPKRKQRQKQ